MYIGSPPHGDDDDDDNDGGNSRDSIQGEEDEGDVEHSNENKNKKNDNGEEEESDDSMASDASSGPSYYRENLPRRGDRSSRHGKVVRVEEEAPKRGARERRRSTKDEADRSEVSGKARKNLKFQTGKRK